MEPTIGRIVIYKTSAYDREIMRNSGFNVQDELPAMIVKHWSGGTCNLQVFLDGNSNWWKTSVPIGDQEATWHWPQIVPSTPPEVETVTNG